MENFNTTLKLLANIIITPKKTIKSINIISYDRKTMEIIFFILSIVEGVMIGIFIFESNSVLELISISIFGLVFICINRKLCVLVSFMLFYLATGQRITFSNTETLLLPLIVLILIASIIAEIIKINVTIDKIYILILIYSWFHYQIYNILRYKLGQNIKRSIVFTCTSALLYIRFLK